MRTAHELGRTLGELCDWPGPMTHREAMAWDSWHDWQLEVPSRADHYQMQTAALIDNVLDVFRKTARNAGPADMLIKIDRRPALTPEQKARHSQAVWLGFLGINPEGTADGDHGD
jgi:hypothetical protein